MYQNSSEVPHAKSNLLAQIQMFVTNFEKKFIWDKTGTDTVQILQAISTHFCIEQLSSFFIAYHVPLFTALFLLYELTLAV